MKHEGINRHRLANNPKEVAFSAEWEQQAPNTLAYVLGDSSTGRAAEYTQRDAQVAASVIQWLGSPIGQSFLEEVKKRIPPKTETWPQKCDLCQKDMESPDDRMEWHGIGNCVAICDRCNGSGIDPQQAAS